MKLIWDEDKRRKTLEERGLDFADAAHVIMGTSLTFPDRRRDYGEDRFITVGFLDFRMVVVRTQRDDETRIISMRKANEREIERYREHLAGPG